MRFRSHLRKSAAVTLLVLVLQLTALSQTAADNFHDAWGARYRVTAHAGDLHSRSRAPEVAAQRAETDVVRRWNEIALRANALDHTPVSAGEQRTFGEQLGPGRTTRALAIVHIAMFDALNAIVPRYQSYNFLGPVTKRTSAEAAVAQAARDTLAALYPSQVTAFDQFLAKELSEVREGRAATNRGIELGHRAAATILDRRSHDGSAHPDLLIGTEFIPSNLPGAWRPDPISQVPIALGALWGQVTPFVLPSSNHFPHEPPPALTSAEYAVAFNEVKRLGADGIVTPTERTEDQTIAGIFWGYDGTPGLGTPPRLYNQIAVHIANQRRTDPVDLARLLALVNVAMTEVGVGCWEAKYFHQFWRPVTGIREADAGTGPTGWGDDNPATIGDPTFTPLGAPASNLLGPNFTPPFPAYSSGHASLGSATFQILRRVYGTDRIRFAFVSDELNGQTTDNVGKVRPRLARTFSSLSEAEEENGQSRIYLGIHWAFDKTSGMAAGRRIADYVFEQAFIARAER